jgi:hypothetical protein
MVDRTDDNVIGIDPLVAPASTKLPNARAYPLSALRRLRRLVWLRPANTVERLKLSKRAVRPFAETSKISLGSRGFPLVT